MSRIEVDTFRLEFAAVQWLNLVTNAEKLFNQLLHSILLTVDEKEQIQRWLCLKHECDECVASDEATSLGEHQRPSLERIEELIEDAEHTEGSSDGNEESTDSQYESDTESDFESHHPDFADKLDGYMEMFRDKTDQLIRSKMIGDEVLDDTDDSLSRSMVISVPSSLTSNVHQQGRRKSLHPGSIQVPLSLTDPSKHDTEVEESIHCVNSEIKRNDYSFFAHGCSSSSIEPYKELKILSSGNEAKKNQIKQSLIDIECMHKRLEEIQHTIQITETFIEELIKNSDARASAKLKFWKKYMKLEVKYFKTQSHIADAKYALHEAKQHGLMDGDREEVMQQKSEIEEYKSLAKQYKNRLKDIGMISALIGGDSAKKVLELESSLLESKKELEKIKEQIQEEEERKKKLEEELLEDQEKMKALEEKYDLSVTKEPDERSGEDKLKWVTDETERLKIGQDKQKKDSLAKDDKRGHLDDKFQELEHKESLREEIRNLRRTKDCLLEQKRSLDEKYRRNKTLTSIEKRTILECDEGIEAIDATIEYKNEILCGRQSLDCRDLLQQREEGEQMLMDRLLKLSPDEMRTLLYKYFQKVIDLKESGKKMEQQIYELEHENESQAWRMQELTRTLQTLRIEAEREKVAMQQNHQEKLHLMLRYFAEESGSSGTEANRNMVVVNDSELVKVKRENKQLKKRLQEMEALRQAAAATRSVIRIRSRSNSPDALHLKQLPAPPSTSTFTSKVTREKNKVIIRLNAPKKKSSSKDVISFCHHK